MESASCRRMTQTKLAENLATLDLYQVFDQQQKWIFLDLNSTVRSVEFYSNTNVLTCAHAR